MLRGTHGDRNQLHILILEHVSEFQISPAFRVAPRHLLKPVRLDVTGGDDFIQILIMIQFGAMHSPSRAADPRNADLDFLRCHTSLFP